MEAFRSQPATSSAVSSPSRLSQTQARAGRCIGVNYYGTWVRCTPLAVMCATVSDATPQTAEGGQRPKQRGGEPTEVPTLGKMGGRQRQSKSVQRPKYTCYCGCQLGHHLRFSGYKQENWTQPNFVQILSSSGKGKAQTRHADHALC
eukprot:1547398-Pleurochrysis_carterae.AAC.1